MYCKNCGKKNLDLAKFCKDCGNESTKLSVQVVKIKKKRNFRSYLPWIIIFVIVIAIVYQPISDWLTISSANPAMIRLAQQSGMSRKGELLFLRTDPQLVSDSQMMSVCPSLAKGFNGNGFVLQGCYDPQANRIYIRQMPLNFQNEEVITAAYEMLHIVYINLSNSGDAAALNQAIESNYSNINDSELNNQVAMLAKTEPGEKDLELFSLLGTGYSNISSALSNYYSPYFTNIGANVTYNKQIFNTFQNYKSQLDQLQNTISSNDKAANTAYANSVSWARVGNAYENNRNYNIYLADLKAENNAIKQYNQILATYNILITEFNGTQPLSNMNEAQSSQ